MGAAAELLCTPEASEERARVTRQRDVFIGLLGGTSFPIAINGPIGNLRHAGNVNVQFARFDAHSILGAVQPRLAASTGSACTSGTPEPSHVPRALGLGSEEADSSVCFSFGRFTTDEEIEEAARLIAEALESLPRQTLRQLNDGHGIG